LEESDKSHPSYALGAVFASLIADRWILATGRCLTGFWHYKLYSAGLVSGFGNWFSDPAHKRPKGSTPDYIAIDDQYNVHLFEAKGGAYKAKTIKDALNQLSSVSQNIYVFDNNKNSLVQNSLAVLAVIEYDKPVNVLAYDPPPDAGDDSSGEKIFINGDVVYCCCFDEALDRFDTLQESSFFNHHFELAMNDGYQVVGKIIWKRIGDLHIGCQIPRSVGRLVAQYKYIHSRLPVVGDAFKLGEFWKEAVVNYVWLNSGGNPSGEGLDVFEALGVFEGAVALAKKPSDVLICLSNKLGLPQEAEGVLSSNSLAIDWLNKSVQDYDFFYSGCGLIFASPKTVENFMHRRGFFRQ
jgi:hypothetical protein